MKYFLLQTDISDAKDHFGYVKIFKEVSDKEKAKIVLSWFVGKSLVNDAIYQGEFINKNDITNKISDVSNGVVNETDTSFIEQYCLGNTYVSILTLAKENKSKPWQSCSACKKKLSKKANHSKAVERAKRNCQKTMLFASDISVL